MNKKLKLIFKYNKLACNYLNIGDVENAIYSYEEAIKKIKDFDGPEIKYNVGLVPFSCKKVDQDIFKYLKKKYKIIFFQSIKIYLNLKKLFLY